MTEKNKTRNKIKILFLIDFLVTKDGLTGGTERQLIQKISRLNRNIFEPILFCLRQSHNHKILDEISCQTKILHIYSFKSISTLFKLVTLYYYLKKNKVDILETYFFESTIIGVFTGRTAGIRKVISCRRDMGFWYNESLLNWISRANKLTQKILVNSQAIKYFVSKQERVELEKIDVIYNGIDLAKFNSDYQINLSEKFPSVSHGDRIVGFVGNFNRQVKRVDLFIKALADVIKENLRVKFIIVGDGKLKPELLQLSQELGVENYLIWAGRIDNPAPYIKNFDIGVISSDSEGFCNAILEYMAAGLPVVATDTGGNPELVENGRSGFLVPINDHHALAEKISFLLANEQIASNMGQRGKQIVEKKFNWNKIIKEYEKYYQGLIKTSRAIIF